MSTPGSGSDAKPLQHPGLRTTAVSDRAQFEGHGATVSSETHEPDAPPRRDLVADVIYYQSNRELFGAIAEAPRLGKYLLERVLGSGAFGAVILGRNPDTGGEVAIKVLRVEARRSEREAQRLHREGQALAQLAHPNVVPVYDAGIADGARYIVMRRVSGATLRQAQMGRDWRAIVDLYVAAARGLAAVHAAGLVHRDFKADNVLVGDDGQVMLADFGLVRLAADAEFPVGARSASETEALITRLTRSGDVFGTPAYMSPEAIENGALGPCSDLFSLAASLFEALYGVLPFAGDTLFAVYLAASQGTLRPRPEATEVPAWLDGVVSEGLRADPRQRQHSVDALILALDFRHRERAEADELARKHRRKRFTIGVGITAALGIGFGAMTMGPVDPCAAPETRIAAAWPDRRGEFEAAVGALDSPPAFAAWVRIRELLDPWSADWSASFGRTCRATFHEGTQSEDLFDARVACLAQRRRELVALVDSLKPISVEALAEALPAAARLESPAACATATRTPTPTLDERRALTPVQEALAESRVRELAGSYAAADQASDAALRDARKIGFAPLLAESLIASGRSKWLVHSGEAARGALTEALDLAEMNALDDLAADASNFLTKIAALELNDAIRGDEWARQTQRKLARIDADPWRRAELLNNRGLLAFHLAGDPDAAIEFHRQALTLRENLPGEARLLVAGSHQNLGNALAARGDLDEALVHYDESRRSNQEVLGDSHPQIFDDAYNRAVTFREVGDYPKATALAEEALAGYLRGADPRSADVADAHVLLSALMEDQRQLVAGLAHARLAAEILVDNPNASPGAQAIAVERIGSLERERGDNDAALRYYDRAIAHLGEDRNFTAQRVAILVNRASTLTNMGRWAEAHSDCDRALRLAVPDRPELARSRAAALRAKGRAFLTERPPEHARAPLEEALLLLADNPDPPSRAEVQFLLAKALDTSEVDRPRALALAQESLDFYRSVNHDGVTQDIVEWITAHQPGSTP